MLEKVEKLEGAFKSIALLNQLILEAGASVSLEELSFMMLNRSVAYCKYDRALLVICENGAYTLRGISGASTTRADSEFSQSVKQMLKGFNAPENTTCLNRSHFSVENSKWTVFESAHNGTTVLWLPLITESAIRGGLIFERWESKPWSDDDAARCTPLSVGYSQNFQRHDKPVFLTRLKMALTKKVFLIKCLIAGVAVGFLCTLSVPLRIVAPCEVVADNPQVVAAPLAGVISNVLVSAGKSVDSGEILFEYERDVHEKMLEESKQKLEVVKASLSQNVVLAFDNPEAKSQLPALQSQLNEERARLEYAQFQNSQLSVTSQAAGIVVLDDKESWIGRPVSVGEKIMQIVNPARSKVRVWIATGDKISFDRSIPLTVVLESQPGHTYTAQLVFDNSRIEVTPDGRSCFRAEATWINTADDDQSPLHIGQTGTAILYGEKVPLIYWIFRRPINALRSLCGF